MKRRQDIQEALRQRIVDGRFPPGRAIPSRRELVRELDVSPLTLQRAFDRLVEQGFFVSRGKQGTFAQTVPPNVQSCALVFGGEPGKGSWNHFWSSILKEGQIWTNARNRHFKRYFIKDGNPAADDHQRLCRDVADGSLAGILFVSAPFFLDGSPALAAPIPKVVIGTDDRPPAAQTSVLRFDDCRFAVLNRFALHGRRRVAAICSPHTAGGWPLYAEEARRLGLGTRFEWWLGLPTDRQFAGCVRTVTRLLFSGSTHSRPDCLLIDDDNLVPQVTEALLETGVSLPAELDVYAHANFPNPTPAAVPCRRFGLDVRTVLAAAWQEIDLLRAGGQPRSSVISATMPP